MTDPKPITKTAFLYTLSDPRTGEVRYVGWTSAPRRRFAQHLSEAQRRDTHKDRWIRRLLSSAHLPVQRVVAIVDRKTAPQLEMEYIAQLRRRGLLLVNSTSGGEGTWNPPPDVRARIGAASRARMSTPEGRAKAALMGSLGRGKAKSSATRAKMANAARNRSPETLAKMAAAGTNRRHSAETKVKLSAAAKRRKANPFAGKHHSQASRAKMSRAQRERWARRRLG